MYIVYIYISREETKLSSFSSLNVNLIHLIPLATVIIANSRRISRERTLVPRTNDYFCPLFSRKRNESAYTGRNEPRALWKALIKLTGSLIAAPRISWARLSCPVSPANPGERDTSLPPVYNETDKKRSGPPLDPVSSSYRVRPFIRAKRENVANFVVEFIYLLFFRGGRGGGQENFGTFGESFLAHTHDTEFNSSTQVFRSWRSSCSWSFETRIYIFYESREELSIVRRKNRSLRRDSITLEFCINFHWFSFFFYSVLFTII